MSKTLTYVSGRTMEYITWHRDTDPYLEGPRVSVQWEDTKAYLSITCSCGAATAVITKGCSHVECDHCGKVWRIQANIRLYEVPEELHEAPDLGEVLHFESDYQD